MPDVSSIEPLPPSVASIPPDAEEEKDDSDPPEEEKDDSDPLEEEKGVLAVSLTRPYSITCCEGLSQINKDNLYEYTTSYLLRFFFIDECKNCARLNTKGNYHIYEFISRDKIISDIGDHICNYFKGIFEP